MPATLLLTDALADQLADAVRRGVPIETATAAAGVSRGQFYEWLQAGERGTWQSGTPVSDATRRIMLAFSDKIRAAQAEHEAHILGRITAAAEAVNEKTGIPEWRAGAWLLNNHPRYRERYREHRQTTIEHQGTVTHEHQLVKQLEPEALEAAWQALQALPGGSENR